MAKHIGLLLFALSWSAFAAEPIATLTAGADTRVNGKAVQTAGAPNWPVAVGDEIVTGGAAAVLSFNDGTRLALGPETKVVLGKCEHRLVQLFQGAVGYSHPAKGFEICALGHPVKLAPGTEGTVSIQGQKVSLTVAGNSREISGGSCSCEAGAPWAAAAKAGMSGATKVALVTAGTAAAAGTAVAVTRPPKKSKDKDNQN